MLVQSSESAWSSAWYCRYPETCPGSLTAIKSSCGTTRLCKHVLAVVSLPKAVGSWKQAEWERLMIV